MDVKVFLGFFTFLNFSSGDSLASQMKGLFYLHIESITETQDECFSMLFRLKYSADYDMLLDTHLWKYIHGKHLACNFTLFRPLYAGKETEVSLVYFKY